MNVDEKPSLTLYDKVLSKCNHSSVQTYQLPPVPLPRLCFPLGVHVLEGCGDRTLSITNLNPTDAFNTYISHTGKHVNHLTV